MKRTNFNNFVDSCVIFASSSTIILATKIKSTSIRMSPELGLQKLDLITTEECVMVLSGTIVKYTYTSMEPYIYKLNAKEKTIWIKKNKHKAFLGRFASRNWQKDFEEEVPEV